MKRVLANLSLTAIVLALSFSCASNTNSKETTEKPLSWAFEIVDVQMENKITQRNWETFGTEWISPENPENYFILIQFNLTQFDTLNPSYLVEECLLRVDDGSPQPCKGFSEDGDFTALPLPGESYMERVKEGIGEKLAEGDKLYCLDSLTLVWEVPSNPVKLEMSLKNSGFKEVPVPEVRLFHQVDDI